jgi:FAD/FMN-containing dehydrogenase
MFVEPRVSSRLSVISEPIDLLRKRVTGEILTVSHPEYDAARRLVAMTANPFPYAIVKVESAEDVAATVDFAREIGFSLTVRSGGHSLAHYSVVDDAVVIDFSKFKRVTVDPVSGIARVQAGATSADIVAAAGPHGLALTTGDTPSVGIGGLTTGGGIGFMVRKYGLTIDSLISAQVVLADGSIVTASKDEHPSLFWAIRGGGGNFGVITEFTFQLARVSTVLGGDIMLPATREVVRAYLDYAISAPEDLTTISQIIQAPPVPYVPADRVGEVVLHILVMWTGSLEEGEKALAPLRALATPVADTIHPMEYGDIYKYTEHYTMPHGAAIRMMFADDLSDKTIDEALAGIANASSPFGMFHIRGLGGAMARVKPDETAFAHRERKYFVSLINVWLDPSENAAVHKAWTANLWDKIKHEGNGVYVNFLEREGDARIREAYPGETYDCLVDVKTMYDPENLFQFNQNIQPRG